jgi:acetyltransferase
MVLANLESAGFAGEIYAVNPRHARIGERRSYPSVSDLPESADLAVVCTPADTVPGIVDECGAAGIRGMVVLSAGFQEAGPEGEERQRRLLEAASRYDGLRIVGPNCLGVISPHACLNASFAAGSPPAGHVAFISQSGALCASVLDWATQQQVGFSHFVSVGNMVDVGLADLIDYFALDEQTHSIILYVESIAEAREFMSAARAFARRKPIVAYKAGRFAASAQAAASHTGAMAGVDAVYQAAFARAGIVRVFEADDMFDCAELLARHPAPKGPRLAILTNAGGPGIMATDALIERNGVLAALDPGSLERLNTLLPSSWSRGNPVDVLGDASPDRIAGALEVVLADRGVDAAIVLLTPQAMTDPTASADLVAKVASHSTKPVLASWMGGSAIEEGVSRLNAAGIPTYSSPEKAVRAFMYLVSYGRNREILYETPRDIPIEFALDRNRLRGVFDTILGEHRDLLTENTSKALLDAYGIPVSKPHVARSADDAVQLARRIGYPVALKVHSPQISHKSDVGGVALNLANDREVERAFERIVQEARQKRPDADVEGVTVQQMVQTAGGYELIVGAKRDPVFGPVVLVGAGGFSAELLQDHAMELPPLNERLCRRMLQSLRSWPLLNGYRSRPPVNIDRLVDVLMRLSYLIADYPEIVELDVNPLLVTPSEVVALDARIALDHEAFLNPVRPYSHLAIRPYPEEWVRKVSLKNGEPLLLRPIKPEDEPLWHELLESCSRESIYFRFRYTFKEITHEMATRYCFIDYDREIAIVAEVVENGRRRLIGVGRLVADADHREAEYAVLVGDQWHGLGLGSILTDYCLEICRAWSIGRIVAETAPDNQRMLAVFQKRQFELDYTSLPDAVLVHKDLG